MKLKNISLSYGDKKVYENFSVEFPENAITCILGASGCGKTSLLNIVTGSVDYSGEVEKFSDKISYIFQRPAVLNHLTVEKNIEFVLKRQVKDRAERGKIVDDILKKVELSADKKRYPAELSGGMEQRLSLARAFSYQSDILLMDEPFKELDISLKKRIIAIFTNLYAGNKKTAVIVTHDIDDAVFLADKIIVLGRNEILLEKDLSAKKSRSVSDFPEIKKEIFEVL